MQETIAAGLPDLPYYGSAEAEAAQAQFSIDDYGRVGDQRPYQIIEPAYPAPKFLERFAYLGDALRECKTLCRLQGKPFRVVRWGREGAGARGGVGCSPCKRQRPVARFPLTGCLQGYPDATPVAEARPNGQHIVFDCRGNPQLVGKPAYAVSGNPFPREYDPRPVTQRYLQAIKTAQDLVRRRKKRAYIVASFAAKGSRSSKYWVPVVYVDPGGLRKVQDDAGVGTTVVQPISRQHFRELIAQSKGASFLGQGA